VTAVDTCSDAIDLFNQFREDYKAKLYARAEMEGEFSLSSIDIEAK